MAGKPVARRAPCAAQRSNIVPSVTLRLGYDIFDGNNNYYYSNKNGNTNNTFVNDNNINLRKTGGGSEVKRPPALKGRPAITSRQDSTDLTIGALIIIGFL